MLIHRAILAALLVGGCSSGSGGDPGAPVHDAGGGGSDAGSPSPDAGPAPAPDGGPGPGDAGAVQDAGPPGCSDSVLTPRRLCAGPVTPDGGSVQVQVEDTCAPCQAEAAACVVLTETGADGEAETHIFPFLHVCPPAAGCPTRGGQP